MSYSFVGDVCLLYTIRGLRENVGGVMIRVRVISKEEPREVKTKDGSIHTVVDSRVGDRTGIIIMSLWDDNANVIEEGDIIDIKNGYVSRFKGRLRLSIGRYGEFEKVDDPDFPNNSEILSSHSIRRRKWKSRRKKG